MAGDTKERILETALALFAQSGYLGTSMRDIAKELGITKGALYKHYASKQEILDSIVERMNKMDYERAEAYEMPETEPDGFAKAYLHTPIAKIRTYSMAQFAHWTKEPFSSNFRKMLTLEQYRDPKLAQLYHDYLATGPTEYMAAIFRALIAAGEIVAEDPDALAMMYVAPVITLIGICDRQPEREPECLDKLQSHVRLFFRMVHGGGSPRSV
ncbi:TetR/AcrR family transcriptional regulator [Ruminococcus champanellensis]|uniref:TetR/AcrR family transcriptional regulator n=1 Tax=Ruminococcus champanellensis TaxID=1161942 RepID=UPI00248B9796|nr:TetR/AcrR family transcriptional regulator [Ruminococcus champanellensis]